MRNSLSIKLAINNIKNNRRFFIPRIISEAGLLCCLYIAITLAGDKRLSEMKGGDYIPSLMIIGVIVLLILSVVIMFYTNNFLMKQRKKEFGIYNILGMEKKHVGRVLLAESSICSLIAIAVGIALGILFYKLCSLLICRLLKSSIVLGFYFINAKSILLSAGCFFVFDIVIYFINLIDIARLKPIELLSSKSAGEKEPNVKWVLLVIGVIFLAAGYYISITTESPLASMELFLVAVLLVVFGTYFLFVSGTVLILKTLKKKDQYYYNKKHMPAVSGLLYRMKQNAVGLASIAILATGVLVMVSTTVSLYAGMDGVLDKNYPDEMYFSATYVSESGIRDDVPYEELENIVRASAKESGVSISNVESNEYLLSHYKVDNNNLIAVGSNITSDGVNEIINVVMITEETYTHLTGDSLNLSDDEIVTCRISSPSTSIKDLEGDIRIMDSDFKVKEVIMQFPISTQVAASGFSTYGIVVSNETVFQKMYLKQVEINGDFASEITKRVAVDFADRESAVEVGYNINDDIYSELDSYSISAEKDGSTLYITLDTYWEAKDSLLGMYGTFLFLGLLLGAVCLFATTLIIYYKQISEGYEDRDRFQIMEKVGMSYVEVKSTINSQILLVFFLPLAVSLVHILFAYPMLKRMLKILLLYKENLFLICTICSFAVFAVVYIIIYKVTSKTYYRIVH